VQSWRRCGEGWGGDDETQGNDNEVVDLGDDAPYMIPCTQMRRGNANSGRGKGIVVIDSQSGDEGDKFNGRGVLMEEYEKRRPQQLQGEEERGKRSKGTTQPRRTRPQNSSIRENDGHTKSTHMYNFSEEEEDDSDTETLSPPRRSTKRSVEVNVGEGEGTTTAAGRASGSGDRNKSDAPRPVGNLGCERVPTTTQTYRRQKILNRHLQRNPVEA